MEWKGKGIENVTKKEIVLLLNVYQRSNKCESCEEKN